MLFIYFSVPDIRIWVSCSWEICASRYETIAQEDGGSVLCTQIKSGNTGIVVSIILLLRKGGIQVSSDFKWRGIKQQWHLLVNWFNYLSHWKFLMRCQTRRYYTRDMCDHRQYFSICSKCYYFCSAVSSTFCHARL